MHTPPLALVTGAARRIGAAISERLHAQGFDLVLHYRHSEAAATALSARLNRRRAGSCRLLRCDLADLDQLQEMITALSGETRLQLLVNNASRFYPTPVEQASQRDWDQLINSNLRAPFFLSTALAAPLRHNRGNIINLVDIHAERGLGGYPLYSIAKAGLKMMTYALAKELAPQVRVNAIAPGPILWPEAEAALSDAARQEVLTKTLLQRTGSAEDIAQAVLYLVRADFVTGQVLTVDGGRSLYS
ncbi:MAG: pteridine reductase [Pseudomonadota bacterium]|jgi:pteridine reductase|nr:pteridine reductase [Pseudomonadota bacterium]